MDQTDIEELNSMRKEKIITHLRKAMGFLANKGKENYADCLENLESAISLIKKITEE